MTFYVHAQAPCVPTVVGEVRVERFESKTYGKTMTVRIWLPAGYSKPRQRDRKYATLYMFDGQTLFDECTAFKGEHELRLDEIVSKLIADGKVPPLIVIGIDSTSARNDEYALYTNPVTEAGKPDPNGKRLPSFVAQEKWSPLCESVIGLRLRQQRLGSEAHRSGLLQHCTHPCSARTCLDWRSSRVQACCLGTASLAGHRVHRACARQSSCWHWGHGIRFP